MNKRIMWGMLRMLTYVISYVSTIAYAAETCKKLAANPANQDGDYFIEREDQSIPVYCYDMAHNPREYIDLNGKNFSEYVLSEKGATRQSVRTVFKKIRLDPASLRVDISDLTFATSIKSGSIYHDNRQVIAMPYATAMACDQPYASNGKAQIDLRGTRFAVDNNFVSGGFKANGAAKTSHDGQLVKLQGGGYCGWMAPASVYNPIFTADSVPFANHSSLMLQLTLRDSAARKKEAETSASCYWMENHTGKYHWVPFPANANKKQCYQLDSCDGGLGLSGGGCYKWARNRNAPRLSW